MTDGNTGKIFEEQQRAIREFKREERILYPLVYPNEISEIKHRLKLANVHYRTEKVFDENNIFAGRKFIIIE